MSKKNVHTRGIRLSFTLAAVICAALGLLLMLMPNTSRKLLCTLIGAGAAAYGLFTLLPCLLSKGESAYTPALLLGVCALAFGVFSLLNPTFLMDFLFIVLGLIALVTAVGGIRRALRLRSFGFLRWKAPLAVSLITLLLALSVVFFPGIYGNLLMMICGALLLTDGICDLLSIYYLSGYTGR